MHGTAGGAEESGCPICRLLTRAEDWRRCWLGRRWLRTLLSAIAGLQSYEPEDRAVISSCLHAFCIGCLQAWCRRSETRLCPLCKVTWLARLSDTTACMSARIRHKASSEYDLLLEMWWSNPASLRCSLCSLCGARPCCVPAEEDSGIHIRHQE